MAEVKEVKERKVMTKTVDVFTSKKGNRFLSVKVRDDKKYFVNLVKDNTKFVPNIPKSAKQVEIEFTSFLYDDENTRLVLFDVRNMIYKG